MKAIAILNWVMFYGINVGMVTGVVPAAFGVPLMIVALLVAAASTQAVRIIENVLAMTHIYATGVSLQDATGVSNGKAKTPTA